MGDQAETKPTPLAIEAANTWLAVRGHPRETIRDPDALLAWLKERLPEAASASPPVTHADLEAFRALRDAIRGLARAAATRQQQDQAALETLNTISASAPTWPHLSALGDKLVMTERSSGPYTTTALAAIARDAMVLFAGPDAGRVGACGAPGCVQFFLREHPRQRWCCAACGNRVRVARHYRRHRHQ
jgi:predicted RNA-binding Zn ribbon-like protein